MKPKMTRISYTITEQNGIESKLGVTRYEAYTADPAQTLAQLREAEARGEVTNIEIEE